MMVYVLALLIGMVAGLRAMTPLAVVSWGAATHSLPMAGTYLRFLGIYWVPPAISVLALGEFVTDQLPNTPSRTVPVQFATRIVSGAICGAALSIGSANALVGAALGGIGAVIGTLGGAAVRARLAARFGRDRPAALIEDAVAVGAALLIVFG